jgi:hypothetical protein
MHENMVYFGDRKLLAQFWSLLVQKKKRDDFSGLSLGCRDSTCRSHATGLVFPVKCIIKLYTFINGFACGCLATFVKQYISFQKTKSIWTSQIMCAWTYVE